VGANFISAHFADILCKELAIVIFFECMFTVGVRVIASEDIEARAQQPVAEGSDATKQIHYFTDVILITQCRAPSGLKLLTSMYPYARVNGFSSRNVAFSLKIY